MGIFNVRRKGNTLCRSLQYLSFNGFLFKGFWGNSLCKGEGLNYAVFRAYPEPLKPKPYTLGFILKPIQESIVHMFKSIPNLHREVEKLPSDWKALDIPAEKQQEPA